MQEEKFLSIYTLKVKKPLEEKYISFFEVFWS